MRQTWISRDLWAGCHQCHGGEAHWNGKNAQGVAARHHDATGHDVWVHVEMNITYGRNRPDDAPAPDAGRDGR